MAFDERLAKRIRRGKPMKGYVFVAPPGRRTSKALERWLDRGLELVAGLEPAPRRKNIEREAPPPRRGGS
jgi:hypothetical protein